MGKPSANNTQEIGIHGVNLDTLPKGSRVTFETVEGATVTIVTHRSSSQQTGEIVTELQVWSSNKTAGLRRHKRYWGTRTIAEGAQWTCGDRTPKDYNTRMTVVVKRGTVKVNQP